ncbi:ATP-binding protein [Iodidimonas sp. SYSU 1G8]|uniref:ATP-binding protein n=1 Tax=Iodidimonas sp. SYSU 1G8 TaxID=3133967 RepID=UPI0031FF0E10
MTPHQRVIRERRQYNQWVANQTLEDYALRFTANSARKWSSFRVANTALGAISFLALEAIGGAITLNYGFSNAAAAILIVGCLIFAAGLPICYYAAKYGVDIDLLTRGAGFGYIGSTITSLIYASFTFIFFALEAAIMALALQMCFGLPLWLGYLISALIAIPLVTHGITTISRFQMWTQPFWIILQLLPFIFIGAKGLFSLDEWMAYPGLHGARDGSLDLLHFGAASAVVFSLIAQIGEQVDYLRFLPRTRKGRRWQWWAAMVSAGPGWVVPGMIKLLAGSFLAVLALNAGVAFESAAEPTQMYLLAFTQVVSQPDIAIALTGAFVIISQMKINVTNAYAGSIAWSNFFSRLTHSHPGRVVWLVFNVAIAIILMELGIYKALEHTLGLYANIAVAWVGAIVADLIINKPLGLSPRHIEFKRAHLYDINPVGVGAMFVASVLSITAYADVFGDVARAMAPFIALGTALVVSPLIAFATGGRFYIARKPTTPLADSKPERCCICEHTFEPEDMAHCPVYSGPICSLCCSLDARCRDACKVSARFSEQVLQFLGWAFPRQLVARLNSRLGQYLGLLLLFSLFIAAILALGYVQMSLTPEAPTAIIADTLWKVFFILIIVAAIVAWPFVLAHETSRVAQQETQRQTNMLMREIDAHQKTDKALQKAKETAEAASMAKSKYVVGISHELRTPLNAILGYAQLLEADPAIPGHRKHALSVVRRSGEHLSGLIDGLLDISMIEAGRLQLYRDEVPINDFLGQLVDMFAMQARAKGLDFVFEPPESLPDLVYTDEKRLRQILINLLSNAIRCTEQGSVILRMRYRTQLATFEVEDTGIGIAAEDLERAFRPFERIETPGMSKRPGTGLGLTITKLLTEAMGGEITVKSTVGVGSLFRVKLMLSTVPRPARQVVAPRRIGGYEGDARTILAVDDDPNHLDLIRDLLAPIGFIVITAEDGPSCLETARHTSPDLILLDIFMPGMNGWDVARRLREDGVSRAPIVMISANAREERQREVAAPFHEGYLMKPIQLANLLDTIKTLLNLRWVYDEQAKPALSIMPTDLRASEIPARTQLGTLIQLGRIGHVRGILSKLDEIEDEQPHARRVTAHLRGLVQEFELSQYDDALKVLQNHEH